MKNTKLLLTLSGLLISVMAFAQGSPPATPIDGGLSLLLLAGGAYGAKKLLEKRKGE